MSSAMKKERMTKMSEEYDPKAPVVMGDLKSMMDMMNDALKKRDEQNEARFNQFAQVLQQVVDRVQPAAAQPQEGGALANVNKGEIVSKVFDKIAERYLGPEQQSDVQQISDLLARAMMREVVLAGKARARVALKKGLLYPEETEGILEDHIEKSVMQHGPV